MARPSKNQQKKVKAQLASDRRYVKLELAHRRAPFMALADFAYLECERCGQEQLDAALPCLRCGHDIARTHALHTEFKAEAEALLAAAAA